MPTRREVNIGNFQGLTELKDSTRVLVGGYADDMIEGPEFEFAPVEEVIVIEGWTREELGFQGPTSLADLRAAGMARGLELCPHETGPQRCLQSLQSMGEYGVIMMKPINVGALGPRIFSLTRQGLKQSIGDTSGKPSAVYDGDHIFWFKRP